MLSSKYDLKNKRTKILNGVEKKIEKYAQKKSTLKITLINSSK